MHVCLRLLFFFFSSRRRHTRSKRDWSSDVCSSDLQTKVYSFAVSDPGDTDTYTGSPDCGTGGTLVGGSYSTTGSSGSQTGSFSCSFPDGAADTDVTISFTDSNGATGNTATQSVHVNNVAPSITISGATNVNE